MIVMIFPPEWGVEEASTLPDSQALPRGSETGRAVRDALRKGSRLFLIGTEGMSDRNGWMAVTDHIRFFGDNPLIGPNRADLGPRFPSLHGLYIAVDGDWASGIACGVPDWKSATPAELSAMGADALVSEGLDEALLVGHGGGRVMMLVRCHSWRSRTGGDPPMRKMREALAILRRYTETQDCPVKEAGPEGGEGQ